ncbi:substrate-binding domain-containing protein [Actinomadura sp. LD22]|uniref:Substrate-binding domain-containing protein n=1 Tax=Actinomadura physcomitrii TaxID=2650748 RepID=A0A6I4MFD3_9ACTN|nr:substrate-binding domain-containing protein [Actinomadura physcomitrii]MWA02687.1 substrate-binding domain-containing protein [Actinomadura physcomitrii]
MLKSRLMRAGATASALAVLGLSACSSAGGDDSVKSAGDAAAKLQGSVAFNDPQLKELEGKITDALKGKDLKDVRVAMVINSPSAYWTEGQKGMENAAKNLGVKAEFQAPAGGDLNQQLSILDTLRSDKIDGYTLSAVDPSAVKGPVNAAQKAGISVVAIDSPLAGTTDPTVYLGTPNTDAGQQAGTAMKTLLGGKGEVAILTGSLTAANAVQRIAGFKKAVEGSGIKIVDTLNDDADPSKALSNAQTALQANPNLKGIYTVWSYDGPAAGQAVKGAGKSGAVKIVADDAEPKTVEFVKSGVVQAMILQRPYQQGYMGVYLLTAMKVLGKDATMKLVQPYLVDKDGASTLNSGIGLVTKANLSQYLDDLAKLGVTAK